MNWTRSMAWVPLFGPTVAGLWCSESDFRAVCVFIGWQNFSENGTKVNHNWWYSYNLLYELICQVKDLSSEFVADGAVTFSPHVNPFLGILMNHWNLHFDCSEKQVVVSQEISDLRFRAKLFQATLCCLAPARYEGEWAYGHQHGKGCLYKPDGWGHLEAEKGSLDRR